MYNISKNANRIRINGEIWGESWSALSPLLFITVMDVISQEVSRGPPHAMLFADDLVLRENTREEAEEQLELKRKAIENKGLRVSSPEQDEIPTVEPLTNDHPHQRPSLPYDHISCDGLCFLFVYESLTSDHPSYTTTPMWFWGWSYKRGSTVPPSSCHDKVKLGGEEIKNVTTFKYLGSMFDAEGGTTTDCENRVRLARNKWREVTGVICDKKVPVKLKHKLL